MAGQPGEARARDQRLSKLHDDFHAARESGNREAEIDALLGLADEQYLLEDLGSAHMHFKLAERVIGSTNLRRERLCEALGGRALVQTSRGVHEDALALFEKAVAAAGQYASPMQVAQWLAQSAGLHRRMKSSEKSAAAITQARQALSTESTVLARIVGRPELLRVMANIEGEAALLDFEAGRLDEAGDGYLRALDYAQAALDDNAIATWAANVGRAARRKRRYTEALAAFDAAEAAAGRTGKEYLMFRAAQGRVATLALAHRFREAGDAAIERAQLMQNPDRRCELLNKASQLFARVCAFDQAAKAAAALAEVLRSVGAVPEQITHYEQEAEQYRANESEKTRPSSGHSRPLEVVIPATMQRAHQTGTLEDLEQMAHLVCDVMAGLGTTAEDAWAEILPDVSMRHRVVFEAISALCTKEKGREAMVLLQRYKAVGFSSFAIDRLKRTGPPHAEAAAYLDALQNLSKAVQALKGTARPDSFADVENVRAAGEALLEAGEILRDRDPVLLARLGGVIEPDDLLDALPRESPVALVDFIVGRTGTAGVILFREQGQVQVMPLMGGLSAKETQEMLKIWSECEIAKGFGKRQADGIDRIGAILHERMFCKLVQLLARGGITQLTLIPDLLTRHLPLHLARICGKEITVSGVDTEGAEYLAEVMPVDYASCVQAIAATQFFRRPRQLSKVVSLGDPMGDLPGARYASDWLRGRIPDTLDYVFHAGTKATAETFSSAIVEADVVVVGTHGHFEPQAPETSSLEFSDGRWTASSLADKELLGRSPVLVLSACETGAIAPTTDDRVASGVTGTLVAAGASSVLASLWPVEDISMGYLIEQFLTYLSYPGYRPSAALFRAVRNLARLPKEDALARCNQFLERLEQDGTAIENPAHYILIDNLRMWIRDSGGERPFSHPMFWGGVVITGSGWNAPAGASVGGAAGLAKTMEVTLAIPEAIELLNRNPREARELAERLLPFADGLNRAKLLHVLACAIWEERGPWTQTSSARRALGLLARAERVADAEEDDAGVGHVRNMRAWIEREAVS